MASNKHHRTMSSTVSGLSKKKLVLQTFLYKQAVHYHELQGGGGMGGGEGSCSPNHDSSLQPLPHNERSAVTT